MGYFDRPKLVRGTLTVQDRSIIYPFMFNPNDVQVTQTPQWGVQNVPGISHPVYQWGSGGERVISFDLFLDGDLQYRPGKIDPTKFLEKAGSLSVLPHINFLESIRYPSAYGGTFAQVAPYKLILTLGTMFKGIEVVCKKSDPSITMWTPGMEPMKAKVSMSFGQKIQKSLTSQDVFKVANVSDDPGYGSADSTAMASSSSAAEISKTRSLTADEAARALLGARF